MQSFRELKVYQKAYGLSIEIHKLSLSFPKQEQFELGVQIRRASKSVALNIAEGYGKNTTPNEFKRYLSISNGSCDETRAQLDYCKDLGYINETEHKHFEEGYREVGKMLISMIKKWV